MKAVFSRLMKPFVLSASALALAIGSQSASSSSIYSHTVYGDTSIQASTLNVGSRYRGGRNYSRGYNRGYKRGYKRSYNRGRHYGYGRGSSGLGYLVGGVIIGSVLSNAYNNSRSDQTYSEQPAADYWVDKYGDCFRLEQRQHGKVYVQTNRSECY